MGGGKSLLSPYPPGNDLPKWPTTGLNSIEDIKRMNVVAQIDMAGKVIFAPGPDPSVYAYSRLTVQRNLYRIPLK